MDKYTVLVEIGGQLAAANIPKLIKAIEAEDLGLDWDSANKQQLEQAIHQSHTEQKPLVLSGYEIEREIPTLRDALQKLNLTWKQRTSATDQYNGEITWWHPGKQKPHTWSPTDPDAEEVHISLDQLQLLSKKLPVKEIVEWLKAQDPPTPPLSLKKL